MQAGVLRLNSQVEGARPASCEAKMHRLKQALRDARLEVALLDAPSLLYLIDMALAQANSHIHDTSP